MKYNLVLFFLLLLTQDIYAQLVRNTEMEKEDPFEKTSFLFVGLNYLNDNVYLGRKDSLTIPYYSPYLGYKWNNGIMIKVLTSFTTTKGFHMDLLTLEAGYDLSLNDHFNFGANVLKFVYNDNTVNVRGNTKGCLGFNGQYNNEIIQPTFTFDVNLNQNSVDYVSGIALDHDFSLVKGTLHILPTLTTFAGTQNYYDEYFTTHLNKKNKKVKVKHVVSAPNQYVPLDYELSCKTTYVIKNWLFTLVPIYAIPVSPSTITLPKKPDVKEKLTNTFFVELDICYRNSKKIN